MRGLEVPIVKYLDSNRSFQKNFMVICSSCKRVKDNEGYWNHLDDLCKIAGMVFSHGLCPQCAKEYSAEIMELARARRTTLNPSHIS